MHHVACPRDAPQFTLSHVAVEACQLLVYVDQTSRRPWFHFFSSLQI
jgi:hypothetical protein